ncbi:MAG: BREX-1 system adenine-specific DNA-methyltransferase PglX, partial [Cytophagia bacterium]|nr:BREX-1 system adenine-specific DNA-methyltransferase PglX [Cytophagia bacterium]
PYFIESPSVRSENYLKVNSVEEITLLDQACGSGHILVYGFELLTRIYEEEGYNSSEIPQLIIENNLYGFEIDDRAAQLAGLALMMKARSYQRGVFKKELNPNILCYGDLNLTTEEIQQTFAEIEILLSDELLQDLTNMQQATNLGSLIVPQCKTEYLTKIMTELSSENNIADIFFTPKLESIKESLKQLISLSSKYLCIVANPPYMGGGKMNQEMAGWVKRNYPDSKADLFSCFIERSLEFVPKHGFNGLVTMESWMFLSSFEKLRKKLIDNSIIHSLTHFGWHIMRIAFGTVTFILEKEKPSDGVNGTYSYMEIDNINKSSERPIKFPIKDNGRYKITNQKDFEKIPGSPIGYWLSDRIYRIFSENRSLSSIIDITGSQNITAKNERFLRYQWELVKKKIQKDYWIKYSKGGEFRKWFGNINIFVDWSDSAIQFYNNNSTSNLLSSYYWLKTGIGYADITSSGTSFRYYDRFIFDKAGPAFFPINEGNREYLLAFCNSKIASIISNILNPTLHLQVKDVKNFPIIITSNDVKRQLISQKSKQLITLSKQEWNSRETSWNFLQNELFRLNAQDLEESYDLYQQYWSNKFFQLHKNEEELNQQFIKIYGLQEELTPDVPLKDITILKDELNQKELKKRSDNYKSGWVLKNGEWSLQDTTHNPQPKLPFNAKEVFAQFISYAVGCMFGRYSLDKEGLILANQGETLEDYLQKINLVEDEVSFLPDDDNIIPVLDDEWFEDDIVGRFFEFLKVSFGKENFDKNLNYVEECLGKNIRKYFQKDFYTNHIKRYKKRPIYWMFSSPKGSFNVLVYMHRYTPDTLNNILNNYLREYQEKLRTRSEHLDHIIETGTTSEQNKARREQDKLRITLLELKEYERDILYPLATERIHIDLDDGVLVNYNKFGETIKRVTGLNDKKTKDKVKKFDWIDTGQIR